MQTRQQKEVITKELAKKIKGAKAAVFSDFKGLAMKDMTALRNELRAEGISLKVVKKTLINIALKEAGVEADILKMEGQIVVAVSDKDEVSVAKIMSKFSKVNDNLKVTGGILEGKMLSIEDVIALSKLPSKEELLAKFIGAINVPISGLVNVLAGNLRGLATVLRAIADKK